MALSGSGGEEEDSKAAVKALLVTIKVTGQEKVVRHTMSMTDKLQVLLDVWYHKVPHVTYGTGVFLFDGLRVRGDNTPADLEMEDGDIIDFFEHMDGGVLAFVAGQN
ncbi:small ubiquitin-related modifier 1-like [Hordeum vulgare subsp. vulgare]|uniref:Ubiquitin-like domain-containing protein n=1 Tax=Hordeum vulgare subsp. vulgare TaxID=112509 RepID=A0A8I6WLZ4_HORVV|nr:small ubiquitin-related modifier 1-like [Hordeum vulgare subsp. vulgare]